MSRSVPQLAFHRFAPATYGVLIALALVTVALVVRREIEGRRRSEATASTAAASGAIEGSDTSSEESIHEAESSSTETATAADAKSPGDPALPRISMRQAPPAATPSASPITDQEAPRVRSVTAAAGLAFPPQAHAAASAGFPPGASDVALPVAATAEEPFAQVVVQVPSFDALPENPWAPRSAPWAAAPPQIENPAASGPAFSAPQSAPQSAPHVEALARIEAPAMAMSTGKHSPGVLTFPDAAPPPQAAQSPAAAATAPPPVAEVVANERRSSTAVLTFPEFAAQPSYGTPYASPDPSSPPYPPAAQPPAEMQPGFASPGGATYMAAQTYAAPPPVLAPPRTESSPPGVTSAAGAPTAPQAIPNPWSTFNASASLGRFTEHGTITLADVRLMALQNNKDVAVLGYVPRVTAAGIDAEASVFDPTFNIAVSGGHYDRQTATQIESLGSTIPVLKTSFAQPLTPPNQVWVDKKFVTGGEAQLGVGQNYYNYSPAGSFVLVNPSHQASINLSVEQPLFRGRGPSATLAATEIARANGAQSWHAFQASVNQVLRDAETAYWETYAAYQEFEVRDLALAQARRTVEREQERLRLGEGSVPDVAQAEEQAEAFHIERTRSEIELVQAQRNLRRLMGLPPGDERPLIPATSPGDEPPVVDWDAAAAEARNRPEFAAQAAAVEAAEIELRRRQNGLLPDLSVRGIYAVSGLDSDFGDAWGSLGTFNFNDWTAGVVYKQPLGRRSDRALRQRACEALAMESARLVQLEHEILHQLDAAYKNMQAAESLLDLHRRRREAAAVQLDARRELYLENRAQLRDQLDAEARYASAMLDEALAKVAYRRAVTDWNYARGAMTGDAVLVRQ